MQNCLKRHVVAFIITPNGKIYRGANLIQNDDIKVCPRVEIGANFGERYDLCASKCQQMGHAEIMAIKHANGADLSGSKLFLWGQDRICANCKNKLQENEICDIMVDISDEQLESLERQMSETTEL